jgi:hypothetical protein
VTRHEYGDTIQIVHSQHSSKPDAVMNSTPDHELRTQLIARAARIQAGHDIDENHEIRWFAAVVGTRGWPGRRIVGADGAHAAFLIASRAPLPYRRAWLAKIRSAVDHRDASARGLCRLERQIAADCQRQLAR